jgi:O-methyltransferase involved in polyketide biosynthesis
MSASETISPTAHYTGYVWARNGLSHPALETLEGRLLFESVRPTMLVFSALGRPSLETYLLARHKAIDSWLEQSIDKHGVRQVVEVAAGLSPRGWRFAKRYGERLTYIEADLPGMTARKRDALTRIGSLNEHHRVEEVDALKDDGPDSLDELATRLDPQRGLAIITEGLLGYLDSDSVAGVWARFATTLKRFNTGRYISDLHIGGVQTPEVRAFRLVLSLFVRGRVHLHFQDAERAERALTEAGFRTAEVQPAPRLVGQAEDPGGRLAHVLLAETQPEVQPASSSRKGSDSSP